MNIWAILNSLKHYLAKTSKTFINYKISLSGRGIRDKEYQHVLKI